MSCLKIDGFLKALKSFEYLKVSCQQIFLPSVESYYSSMLYIDINLSEKNYIESSIKESLLVEC